ncbi:molybdopterin molybdotransferase MoeA [Rhizobium sp. KVB221]|uniref:Molybdopterin molybdenumtransferase n=1 Tax=Rhizobium setariae TaxID=2801340 RepID=A0A936YNZ8_9HYPH|nr:gephyrin-like molybdotransferase Glp [Rhizobium setariae]MBL0372993.1 molybdopterin molybdotransferase MoeA [Rhizobium setariae]
MALLPVVDAVARLLNAAKPIDATQTVPLMSANQRVLATEVAARLTQPPFDASAMDGYAVRSADVASIGTRLSVIGESAAGKGFAGEIQPGEAVRIFTGAPVPAGADAVLLQEDATLHPGGVIENTFSVASGRHIRPRGQDFSQGEFILHAGDILDPGRLMVAAAMNHPEVTVYRKPLVALIATGSELVPPGAVLGEHQIVASNTFAIAALAQSAGADVLDLGIVPDDTAAISAAVRAATDAKADVIVTLGGASVGDHDLVQSTLKGLGMVLDFWRIAMRPGKPLMVGSLGDTHVLGLPGNPVSSMVCALLFLEPLIAKLARLPQPARERSAVTGTNLAANDHRQDYLRARVIRRADGTLEAHSYGKQDSSQMKIFANSDALIVRPPGAAALPAGSACPILLLRDIV